MWKERGGKKGNIQSVQQFTGVVLIVVVVIKTTIASKYTLPGNKKDE